MFWGMCICVYIYVVLSLNEVFFFPLAGLLQPTVAKYGSAREITCRH